MLSNLQVSGRIATLGENTCPAQKFPAMGLLQVFDDVSQGRRWGSDGACLESVSGFSHDPIGYRGGINLYEYVGDDPTDNVDPMGTAKRKVSCNRDFAGLIDALYNSNLGKLDKKTGCRTIPFDVFLKYLRDHGLSGDQADVIANGCIGIAEAVCANMNPVKQPDLPEGKPLTPPWTYCFVGDKAEEKARKYAKKCPPGSEPFVFAKQGIWSTPDGKPPLIPGTTIISDNRCIIGKGKKGDRFNYVTLLGSYYVSANSGAAKPGAYVTICKKPNLADFPATMWCAGCCKKR